MPKKLEDRPIPESFFSTGEIARYCHTVVNQVNRWIKSGDLKAFKNPGGHYRIAKKDFRDFLERNNMPIIESFFHDDRLKRILIADDEESVTTVISDIVSSYYEDIEVRTVHDGYEALITVGSFKPDLLILDLRMPKVDGLEVCKRLRSNEALSSSLKILAMTAHSDLYDRDIVLEAGADEYLIKPVEMTTLIEHVDLLL